MIGSIFISIRSDIPFAHSSIVLIFVLGPILDLVDKVIVFPWGSVDLILCLRVVVDHSEDPGCLMGRATSSAPGHSHVREGCETWGRGCCFFKMKLARANAFNYVPVTQIAESGGQ